MKKTVILALENTGKIPTELGGDFDGMEVSLRDLPAGNAGRLIHAVTVEEIGDVSSDVLVFTENVVVEFSFIERLLQLPDSNIVVVRKARGRESLRVLTDEALRVTAILGSIDSKGASADLSPIGLYKFEPSFLRAIAKLVPVHKRLFVWGFQGFLSTEACFLDA
ncbi:hypothetical protein [Rhizobium tibeticum]|uniref:hypothetical protein n=1 Tax=Rhizobium tibeticum TaxID=501024 RepID=UPI001160BD8A|nr:hypothetical protein [Rhizobium tibeticum]